MAARSQARGGLGLVRFLLSPPGMPTAPRHPFLVLGAALAVALGPSPARAAGEGARYALRGDLITPAGVVANGTVVIAGGRIESVGTGAPEGVRVIDTQGVISPGLIDLHNHLTWNVFAHWSAGRKFPNRYEWQQLPEYNMALAGPHAILIARGLGPVMARYAEVKAIAGGSTSLAGLYPDDLGPTFHLPYHGMMRMLDIGSGLHPPGVPEGVEYHVFPLTLAEPKAAELRAALKDGSLKCLLIHVGEGSPTDASSKLEFQILKARGLLLPGVTLIHGVALQRDDFAEMARVGVGLVWSPRSNFELYGATADVVAARQAGVRVALAPDWSPTGSDGLVEELGYAAAWNAAQDHPPFTDADLVAMATAEPARLAGVADRIGALAPGLAADLLVMARAGGDAPAAVVHGGTAGVGLVIINGRVVYGRRELAEAVSPGQAWTALTVAGAPRVMALPADPGLGDWGALNRVLDAQLRSLGARLGPLAAE
jgi:5-methylthioadenosine/S-adenosylhomocysteine deaminase